MKKIFAKFSKNFEENSKQFRRKLFYTNFIKSANIRKALFFLRLTKKIALIFKYVISVNH